ncbi:DUF6327 family protein [Aureitalea marina]|uniref:Glutaminyl-tRNA synthetase n=1 Tax=Aureitalea marina TaxID=930804 RepID=A0A2S7KME0_9FLAO|nr:DUF6327 family protein [Aureitalea marina]PQB03799.1 hypothetical protein BST85_01930 [Aureitalea marina]
MKKHYESFEEIEKELAMIRLKRQIAAESIRFTVNKTKDQLSPDNLVVQTTDWFRKVLLGLITKKALKSIVHLIQKKS